MSSRPSKESQNKISTDEESQDDYDCECQILHDTSLSNISDESCDCSQCLEANLNAYNQIREMQELEQQQLKHAKSMDKIQTKTKLHQNQTQKSDTMRSTTRYGRANNMSLNKPNQKSYLQKNQTSNISHSKSFKTFTQQNLNDYIMITKQRTRQYLNQRNKIDKINKKQKEDLKKKIKENLEILKYTVEALSEKEPKKQGKDQDGKQNQEQVIHAFKWNHTPIIAPQIKEIRRKKTDCKRKIQQRKNTRTKVDTNLEKIIPQFSNNPSQFLQEVKEKRLQKLKPCKGCPHDHCPNHHMRTSKEKLEQIEKFIKNKVKEYNENRKKQKQKEEESDKVKRAKLRAIDIKCKEILKRSKKQNIRESRTSFCLSIDHFSTFSDLRINKQEKDQQRQHRKQVRKMLKQKGGKIQEAIYEEVFENQHPPQPKSKPVVVEKNDAQHAVKKEYCQKITKDAKIHSPKKLKADDEKYRKEKQQKRKIPMNPNEERKKAKELTLEIERKKHELMQEYKRQQELKKSKNQKLKNEHKELLVQSRDSR